MNHPLALRPTAMAAQGRNGDSMLVHMNPQEVAGLHALAMARDGQGLTINPQTGLPEAFKLKDLLPAIAGIALGPAGFGLMSAGSAALTVGGIAALSSGSLAKGISAGLGAYGASNLASSLEDYGSSALSAGAANVADAGQSGPLSGPAWSNAPSPNVSNWDKFTTGASNAMSNPGDFAKNAGGFNLLKNAYMAASPLLAADTVKTTTPRPQTPGYIRPYTHYDPQTGSWRAEQPIEASSVRLADGGDVDPDTGLPVGLSSGNMTGASRNAMEYLMGRSASSKGYVPPSSGIASLPATQGQPTASGPSSIDVAGGKYVLNPATGRYTFQASTPAATPGADAGAGLSGLISGQTNQNIDSAPSGQPSDNSASLSGPTTGVSNGLSTGTQAILGLIPGGSMIGQAANAMTGFNNQALVAAQSGLGIGSLFGPNSTQGQAAAASMVDNTPVQGEQTLGPTATMGPSGTGGSAAAAAAQAASQATNLGLSDEDIGAASQAAANAVIGGQSVPAAVAAAISSVTGGGLSTGVGTVTGQDMDTATQSQADAAAPSGPSGGNGDIGGANGDISGLSVGDIGGAPAGPSGDVSGDVGAVGDAGSVGDASGDAGSVGDAGDGSWARGGIARLALGGMRDNAFVVPADVVSALGNGSTDAGISALNRQLSKMAAGGATPIRGPGDGLSDSIPTHIDGKRKARVANGEAYIDPETVARLGGGDSNRGSKKLYRMMDKIRQQAHGKTTQQRPVNPDRVLTA